MLNSDKSGISHKTGNVIPEKRLSNVGSREKSSLPCEVGQPYSHLSIQFLKKRFLAKLIFISGSSFPQNSICSPPADPCIAKPQPAHCCFLSVFSSGMDVCTQQSKGSYLAGPS